MSMAAKVLSRHALESLSDQVFTLTLTSEWKDLTDGIRFGKGSRAGFGGVAEGALNGHSVRGNRTNTPLQMRWKLEIRAQINRALDMGLESYLHLDSHNMVGPVFINPPFSGTGNIKVAVDYGIPVMFPGGNIMLLEISMIGKI